jgi:hypothetical protein
MSVEVIKKLRELIFAGATVVGPPPEKAVGLKNYPESDKELRKIADEIWGDLDGKIRTERKLGKGRVIWGKTPREILLADGITPDFTFVGHAANPEQFDYIHRTNGDAEIYFVINRTNQPVKKDFTFRVTGKQPEIWNVVTGEIRKVNAFEQANGSTTINLDMDRFDSYFIVFRKPVPVDAGRSQKMNFPELKELTELSGSWKISFDPKWGGPDTVTFPKLISWTDRPEDGIKYYSGKATYKKMFDLKLEADENRNAKPGSGKLFLDLGELKDVAEVRLNGKNLGTLWCAPWRVEITDAVKPTGNLLEINVINLWANRVIGDLSQPKEKRFTKTHDAFRFDFLTGKTPLIKSGLLGPVKLYLSAD